MYGSVSGNAEENKSKSVLFLRQLNQERNIHMIFGKLKMISMS